MLVSPIKLPILKPPKDDLLVALQKSLPKLTERTVIVIASKVVSIHEGRCILIKEISDKDSLIKQEADQYLERSEVPGQHVMHTMLQGTLMPSAGVDESNGNGYYILWPKNPQESAKMLWQFLRGIYRISDLGVIISDSRSEPLRRGLGGISIGFWGIEPLYDYRGTADLFGRLLKISRTNVIDSIASAAVFVMGEGSESTPAALVEDVPTVSFTDAPNSSLDSFIVPMEEDLFYPFLKSVPWKRGPR